MTEQKWNEGKKTVIWNVNRMRYEKKIYFYVDQIRLKVSLAVFLV